MVARIENKPPKDVALTGNIEEDFFKDDFKLSGEVPALLAKMSQTGVSRRGKLTPERYEAIIKYVRNGAHINHAANATGIDDKTLYTWLKKGAEEPESVYGYFLDDYNMAKGDAILKNVKIVQTAADDDWTAAKWLLQVLDPDRFGNKSTVKTEISGPDGEAIKYELVISDEEIRKLAMIQAIIDDQNKVVDASYTIIDDEEPKENKDFEDSV